MSEQKVNLFGSIKSTVSIPTLSPSITLAAPYTAGSGSMTLSATTDPVTGAVLPSTGTFSLTILNAQTGQVYLIFRVSSVAGAVVAGAAEGPDANAPVGAAVVGTMLTVAALNQIAADIIASSGITLAQIGVMLAAFANPVLLSWTWFNQAGSTVTNSPSNDAINLMVPNSGGNNISGQTIPIVGSSPYTLTIAIYPNLPGGNFGQVGIVLTDGTNYIIVRINNNSGAFDGWTWTGTGTPNTNIFNYSGTTITPLNRSVWFLRIQETVSNRIYSLSLDGINFHTMFSEAAGAYIVPTAGGFFGLANGQDFSAGTVVHVKLTTP